MCERCRHSKQDCVWSITRTGSVLQPKAAGADDDDAALVLDLSPTGRRSSAGTGKSTATSTPGSSRPGSPMLDAAGTVSYFVSRFHLYSHQICAWTDLLDLPRKSILPSILQYRGAVRQPKRRTNWANFFLPQMSRGSQDDILSCAMTSYAALREGRQYECFSYYGRTMVLMRRLLSSRDAVRLDNQEFLALWSAMLLLAEVESFMGNQETLMVHVDAATRLSYIAVGRFIKPPDRGGTALEERPRNERELPNYLTQLTQRLAHSSMITRSLDTDWPTFESPPIQGESLGGLLAKSAELYGHVMPLCEEFFTRYAALREADALDATTVASLTAQLLPRAAEALRHIGIYKTMLERRDGREVYLNCAEPGFPFSPVIRFIDPNMAQPSTMPYVLTLFLAPFVPESEVREAVRYMSGVYAGFRENVKIDAAFPDLYVAAFWRRGWERDYFRAEMQTLRGEAFNAVTAEIWANVDGLELMLGRPLSATENLGIALQTYKKAAAQGVKLANVRH